MQNNWPLIGALILVASVHTLIGCNPKATHPENMTETTKMAETQNGLRDFPIANYIGKTVASLLIALPATYSRVVFLDNGRPGILEGAQFQYDSLWLIIKLGELKYLPRFNERNQWDIDLFKKEEIAAVSWEQ